MKKSLLLSLLSLLALQKEAGEKVFARGKAYYEEDAVRLLYHVPTEAVAEVEGSQTYRVDLKNVKGALKAECTCPAIGQWGFCKHAVALGFYLLDNPTPTHEKVPEKFKQTPGAFEKTYPNITAWIQDGWIEIGRHGQNTSLIRILDEGGLVWEGGTRHKSIDQMLAEAEKALDEWL
jgi:hypothetical protein